MQDDTTLTERQRQILTYIREKIRSSGYPPSVREIGQGVGLRSSSTVHNHLVQLEEKGFLRKDPTKPRAIIPVDSEGDIAVSDTIPLPVVGSVAAGSPILAEQNIEEYLPVPVDFVGPGSHFILRVKGDSMIEAGIFDGDYLIVRQQQEANNGEIVVALIEDEATVKRFYKRNTEIELKPENTSMSSIFVRDARIAGKVSGLLRRF
ncbi:sos-response repressor and protease lexa [hydrocarbon metagenome]|uniref:Sos-response repressor and protease lexa n=1 Tax=hydrocarbon metagenome TaxID=938273 RepID=A0A0W8E8C6_9ZZZZ